MTYTFVVFRVRNDEKVATILAKYCKVEGDAIILYDGRSLQVPDAIYPVEHFYITRLETPDA